MVTETERRLEQPSPLAVVTAAGGDAPTDGRADEASIPPASSHRSRTAFLNDVPVWSAVGSVLLLAGILFFQDGSMSKYIMLVSAQASYLLSVLTR